MQVSLGERDGNNGVRERCSRVRQWTPIGFEWHEPSASAAAEERRGVGTNIGRYVPPLERSGETEDSNPVLSGKELGELPTASLLSIIVIGDSFLVPREFGLARLAYGAIAW
jgi:hypothetical protein